MLRERTCRGLETARKEGRIGGRHSKLTENQKSEILLSINSGQKPAADAARLFNVHPATISRLLQLKNGKA
jgi:DNA invertase Pin-like site-specific DNA recombinase